MASGEDSDDLLFLLAIGAGLAVFFTYFRQISASDASSGVLNFPAIAPGSGSPLGDMLEMLTPLNVSPAGRALIQANEGGFQAWPYTDAAGRSIGYGHFIQPTDNIVPPITQDQADQLFNADLVKVESAINSAVTVELNQDQFDALADFVFNEGAHAFETSTLLRLLNAGDYAGAADQFARWNISSGRVNAGLVARRGVDENLFNMGSTGMTGTTGSVG